MHVCVLKQIEVKQRSVLRRVHIFDVFRSSPQWRRDVRVYGGFHGAVAGWKGPNLSETPDLVPFYQQLQRVSEFPLHVGSIYRHIYKGEKRKHSLTLLILIMVIPNLFEFLSSAERNRRYLEERW